jgi:hypothetical protein
MYTYHCDNYLPCLPRDTLCHTGPLVRADASRQAARRKGRHPTRRASVQWYLSSQDAQHWDRTVRSDEAHANLVCDSARLVQGPDAVPKVSKRICQFRTAGRDAIRQKTVNRDAGQAWHDQQDDMIQLGINFGQTLPGHQPRCRKGSATTLHSR